jgi:CheY-like chemotaxis protein
MAEARPLARRRILIAEDNLLVAMQIEDSLRRLGAEPVGPVGRLSQALELAKREVLDGALLDVDLGGELVFPAAEVLEARRVPIIFATGHDGSALLSSRFASHARLRKPYPEQELARLAMQVFAPA